MIEYLTKDDIIYINKRTVKSHGGNYLLPYNLLNEGPLDYLIDIVKSEVFGVEVYPTISYKTALYMFSIISNHIFSDGNKRTGLEAALAFLTLNGKAIDKKISLNDLYDFTVQVATSTLSLEEVHAWFDQNIVDEYL